MVKRKREAALVSPSWLASVIKSHELAIPSLIHGICVLMEILLLIQHTANEMGKAWRPVHISFADSNHHNGSQYIHTE